MWQLSLSPSLSTCASSESNRSKHCISATGGSPFIDQHDSARGQRNGGWTFDEVTTSADVGPFPSPDVTLRRSQSVPARLSESERDGPALELPQFHGSEDQLCPDAVRLSPCAAPRVAVEKVKLTSTNPAKLCLLGHSADSGRESDQLYDRCQSFEGGDSSAYPEGSDWASRLAAYLTQLLRLQGCASVDGNPCNASELSVFSSEIHSASALSQFAQRVSGNMGCSASCYVLAGIYLNRLLERTESLWLTAQNIVRLYFTALVLGVKYLDDQFFTNRYYSERCADIGVSELGRMEMSFLRAINYELFVSPESFAAAEAIQATMISVAMPRLLESGSIVSTGASATLVPAHVEGSVSVGSSKRDPTVLDQFSSAQAKSTPGWPAPTEFVAPQFKSRSQQVLPCAVAALQASAVYPNWCNIGHDLHPVQFMAQGTQIMASNATVRQLVPLKAQNVASSIQGLPIRASGPQIAHVMTSNALFIGAMMALPSSIIQLPLQQLQQLGFAWVPAGVQHFYRPLAAAPSQIPVVPCRAYVSCWQTRSRFSHFHQHWNHQPVHGLLY